MKTYKVNARFIKNTLELEEYRSKKNGSKTFEFEIAYRSGEFYIDLSEDEFHSIDKENEHGKFKPCDYSNFELIETFDSWSTTFHFDDLSIPNKEQTKIQDQFYEVGLDVFEKCGYEFVESYFVLLGCLDFELVDEKMKKTGDGDIFSILGIK